MSARICFVCPRAYGYFVPEEGLTGGGAQRQIHLLSTSLTDRFDVHVVVADYGQARTERKEGVTLHKAYPLHPRKNILQPIKHLTILGRAMRRAAADVYIHRGSPRNAAFVRLLARLLQSRWIYNIANDANIAHRPANLPTHVRWLYARALQDADAIIAQTTHQQRLVEDGYATDAVVVPNGYPTVDVPSDTGGEYFLWVGRLEEYQKRPHLYLECAEQTPSEQFRLVGPIDSEDQYHQKIRQRAAELENVELVGEVSPEAIHDQYRNAIALVNTSTYEGFPNVFLEAWRQQTPVVSLELDPKRYGIPDDVCADGDLGQLQTLLQRLAGDETYRDRLATNARNHFESTFEQSRVAQQYGDVIQRVLTG